MYNITIILDKVNVIQETNNHKYKGRTYSVDKDVRKEYVEMMQSGKYTMAYLAKMAKVSRQTLYNWKTDLQQEN